MSKYNEATLKKYNRTINGLDITAYNDSNAEWIVQYDGSNFSFDKRKITMKDAMQLIADIFAED